MTGQRGMILLLIIYTSCAVWSGVLGADCTEKCCCKVCTTKDVDAFPYGKTTVDIHTNPVNPHITGAKCKIPVWSDRQYKDPTSGQVIVAPDTLFWTLKALFGDDNAHVAPSTCSCCTLSVDTGCQQEFKPPVVPTSLTYDSRGLVEGESRSFTLANGGQLSSLDIIEVRKTYYCGYEGYTVRYNGSDSGVVIDNDKKSITVTAVTPEASCYNLCYYHDVMKRWFYVTNITVVEKSAGQFTVWKPDYQVQMTGAPLEFVVSAVDAVNIWTDSMFFTSKSDDCDKSKEIICSGCPGQPILMPLPGATWCSPPLKPTVSKTRPLHYLPIKVSDCLAANRVMQRYARWNGATLPVNRGSQSLKVCYLKAGNPRAVGMDLAVEGKATVIDGLKAFYASFAGDNWNFNTNWKGNDPCVMYGVYCNEKNQIIRIILADNNLVGTFENRFFMSDIGDTIEHLTLSSNDISGTLPTSLNTWRSLKVLNLAATKVTGKLPPGVPKYNSVFLGTMQTDPYSPTNGFVNKLICKPQEMTCSAKGSQVEGVEVCGTSSILQNECEARGCCYNAQAQLVFGGAPCFTKSPENYTTYPVCQERTCQPKP